ncbi:MAG: response regulator [Chloroflexota bacterium]|nr:response regulator [Chloroflexota bacterium]
MGAKILVVDDDRPTVLIISSVLKKKGYEVHTAFDGVSGLKKAQDLRPDLIVLDIMMPGMDGYQVCRQLQNDPDTSRIAVLMLTAKGGVQEDVKRAYEFATRVKDRLAGFDSGAMDFLTKPVKAKEVARRVKALLWASGVAT